MNQKLIICKVLLVLHRRVWYTRVPHTEYRYPGTCVVGVTLCEFIICVRCLHTYVHVTYK